MWKFFLLLYTLPLPALTPRDGTPEHCFLLTFTQVIHMVISCTRSPATTLHHRDTSMPLQQLFRVKFDIWLTTPLLATPSTTHGIPTKGRAKENDNKTKRRTNRNEREWGGKRNTPRWAPDIAVCASRHSLTWILWEIIYTTQSKYGAPVFDLQHAALLCDVLFTNGKETILFMIFAANDVNSESTD